jgi:alpha-methylacyl-CoA racemase
MTGWGQDGPLAQAAGHDLNYVSLTGAMSIAGRPGEAPMVPATLVGDMGGGGMFLAFGIACALLEARRSGRGQVIDAAMVDGVSTLAALIHQRRAEGSWSDDPRENFFLGASPFYDVFECADGRHVSVGAIEGPFYAELLRRLGLDDVDPRRQYRTEDWPALRQRVAARLREHPSTHWRAVLEGSDACFAPVLDFDEAAAHPHLRARSTFVEVGGRRQPAVAPRLSRTPGRPPAVGPRPGEHTAAVLGEVGLHPESE